MAEEDNFDIDIYGDDGNRDTDYHEGEEADDYNYQVESAQGQKNGSVDTAIDTPAETSQQFKPADSNAAPSSHTDVPNPHRQPQGTKRKESSDERPIDPGSTQALMISELHWWTTEDDIRGWAVQSNCENELKDVTFNEHKVNGKGKGQAYVDFTSSAAATALKHKIESLLDGTAAARKFSVVYTNHLLNPYKTSPKDAPTRKEESKRGAYNNGPPHQPAYQNSNFRGRGSGGYNRGGGLNAGGYNNNRNFNGGYNNAMLNGGFQGGMQNGMMNGFNGGFNRGGGMAMRGRGGMNAGIGMGMPMGGMPMGMNPMMAGMNMGFQGGQNMFNPAMFGQAQVGWAQQGQSNKRQRQE